jgi:nucleoside 2-deoxyribosyltransferase
MPTCFVMQPFDKGKYDLLYITVFEQAIKNAGLIAYRVDKDLAASDLRHRTLAGIREADICFAEITDNNPNVMFEIGYAFCLGKEVVMISEGRNEIPFHFQYNPVTLYKSDSQSDLAELASTITKRLTALLETRNKPTEVVKHNPNVNKKPTPPPARSKPANAQPKSTAATPKLKQSPAQRRAAAIQNARPSTGPPAYLHFDKAPPEAKKKSWWDDIFT